jgi:cold shock CspA family protein
MLAQVNSYLPNRGFGFLKADDGLEYFFHYSNFTGAPRLGARVSFDLADPVRFGQRKQAVNIQIIEDPLGLLAGSGGGN